MARVLTVDDSRAIRNIVSKTLTEMGHEVDEAEDGLKGLAQLEEVSYELVVLDVTMPELDGTGMLTKMRERGDRTPVLMLTSESKRSVIAECMKLGIGDYILKPFKPEELRAKVNKVLSGGRPSSQMPAASPPPDAGMGGMSMGGGGSAGFGGGMPAAAPAMSHSSGPVGGGAVTPGRQFIDVLVIDDMENVHKKLRSLLPPHFSMNACVSAQTAIAMCRERVYRVIVMDVDIPDVDSGVLQSQLRLLQPSAAVVALVLRTANDVSGEMRAAGFDDVLLKPFAQANIEDFLLRFFDNQEILSTEDNVLKIGAFTGKEDRLERYFRRLVSLSGDAIEKLAAACYDDVILDLSQVPLRQEHLPKALVDVDKKARNFGITLRVVGTADCGKMLKNIAETAVLPFFDSLGAARAA